jgi:hypothetical protein
MVILTLTLYAKYEFLINLDDHEITVKIEEFRHKIYLFKIKSTFTENKYNTLNRKRKITLVYSKSANKTVGRKY